MRFALLQQLRYAKGADAAAALALAVVTAAAAHRDGTKQSSIAHTMRLVKKVQRKRSSMAMDSTGQAQLG